MALSISLLSLTVFCLTTSGCVGELNCTETDNSCERSNKTNSAAGDSELPLSNGSAVSEDTLLKLLVFYPASDVECLIGNGTEIGFNESCEVLFSIQRALSEIEQAFSDFTLEVVPIELQPGCGEKTRFDAIAHFINAAFSAGGNGRPKVAGVIGPSCSNAAAAIASLIQRRELPIVHVHTAVLPIDRQVVLERRGVRTEDHCSTCDDGECSNSFGMLGSTDLIVKASLSLMRQNNWTSIAVLYDRDSDFRLSSIFKQFASAVETLEATNSDGTCSFISPVYDISTSLNEIRNSELRIIYVVASAKVARKILCFAFHRKMFPPAYQWVLVSTPADEVMTEVYFNSSGESYFCSVQDMIQTLDNSFIITYKTFSGTKNVVVDDSPYGTTSPVSAGKTISDSVQNINVSIGSLYYDAFWTIATAVNHSLSYLEKHPCLSNKTFPQYIKEQLYTLDTIGASGRIIFNRKTGFVERAVRIYQIHDGILVQIALYNSHQNGDLILLQAAGFSAISDSFQKIPLLVPLPLGLIFLVTTAVVFFVIVASHILNIIFRKSETVRASSPKLQHLAYTGSYFLFFAMMIYLTTKTFATNDKIYIDLCIVHNYVITVGMTLLLGTICAKTWRLHRIFTHYLDPGNYLTDRNLAIFVLSLTTVDIGICTLWKVLDTPSREIFFPENYELQVEVGGVIHVYSICHSNFYFSWFAVLCAYQIVLMIAALYLALKTRKCIPKSQKKFRTTSVISFIYLICFLMVFGFAFFFIAQYIAKEIVFEFVVWSVLFNLVFVSCVVFLFLPPLIPVLRAYLHGSTV